MYAAIMQDQEANNNENADLDQEKAAAEKLENAAAILRSLTYRQKKIQEMDEHAKKDINDQTFD